MEQNTGKPKFGSKAWIANAILLKFKGSSDHPAENIETLADYLALKKIEAALWPAPESKTTYVWIDPPDFPLEQERLPLNDTITGVIQ